MWKLSDESKFGKRKYNRGRTVDGHWVFGGVERMTGECFLVEVLCIPTNGQWKVIVLCSFAIRL